MVTCEAQQQCYTLPNIFSYPSGFTVTFKDKEHPLCLTASADRTAKDFSNAIKAAKKDFQERRKSFEAQKVNGKL